MHLPVPKLRIYNLDHVWALDNFNKKFEKCKKAKQRKNRYLINELFKELAINLVKVCLVSAVEKKISIFMHTCTSTSIINLMKLMLI